MVVEIFVTLAQRIHALAQQGQLVVSDIVTIAGIREPCIDGFEQPQPSASLPDQSGCNAIFGDNGCFRFVGIIDNPPPSEHRENPDRL